MEAHTPAQSLGNFCEFISVFTLQWVARTFFERPFEIEQQLGDAQCSRA
jgi:hypothetical protein